MYTHTDSHVYNYVYQSIYLLGGATAHQTYKINWVNFKILQARFIFMIPVVFKFHADWSVALPLKSDHGMAKPWPWHDEHLGNWLVWRSMFFSFLAVRTTFKKWLQVYSHVIPNHSKQLGWFIIGPSAFRSVIQVTPHHPTSATYSDLDTSHVFGQVLTQQGRPAQVQRVAWQWLLHDAYDCYHYCFYNISTAQGGGGSFQR